MFSKLISQQFLGDNTSQESIFHKIYFIYDVAYRYIFYVMLHIENAKEFTSELVDLTKKFNKLAVCKIYRQNQFAVAISKLN